MKHNPFSWSPVSPGKWYGLSSGRLSVKCSQTQAVLIRVHGVESLAGYGPDVRVEIAHDFEFMVDGKGHVFVEDLKPRVYASEGEVFTNMDRKPHESGAVQEVLREVRRFRLDQMALRREAALAARKARNSRRFVDPPRSDEVSEPVAGTPPDDALEASAEGEV